MKPKEHEISYYSFGFLKGLLCGFATFEYPEFFRVDSVIYILFIRIAHVRQMVDEDELQIFLDS